MSTAKKHGGEARERIARKLRLLRTERKLSQEKMAELANFHRTYVSQLERCVTNISIDGLERLASALGVDISALLEPIPAKNKGKK
ncbi:MAG: transcriptional regulator [Rhodocyclales bacterium]|jgi:transcriptional regulator with XRE-family HTH domain|nr:helix-turn-helix transcriptional regulator [Sulfuritalea sp.]PWB39871.1 MAG: transcriptional regulator [Rhodocyclales bacterium]